MVWTEALCLFKGVALRAACAGWLRWADPPSARPNFHDPTRAHSFSIVLNL